MARNILTINVYSNSSGCGTPNLIKSVDVSHIVQKNKNGKVFETHCRCMCVVVARVFSSFHNGLSLTSAA